MLSIKQIFFDFFIMIVISGTIMYLYQVYGTQTVTFLFGEQSETIFIEDLSLSVTIANDAEERRMGLSGVEKMKDLEGKLFIFDTEGAYAMWMKDMLIPIDILWIDNNLRIVHIEENVTPDSFPATFVSDESARFVLEVNAFFVETFNIEEQDSVIIPATALPQDLKRKLQ